MNIEDGTEADVVDGIEVEVDDLPHVEEEPEIEGLSVEKAPEREQSPELEVRKEAEPSLDDELASLKQRLADSERNRENSARLAEAEARRAAEAEKTAIDSQISLFSNAIEIRKQVRETLKARMAEAKRAQDYESEIDLQEELTRTTYELSQLEDGKRELERAPRPQPRAVQDADPADALARSMEDQGFSRSAQWLRSHPEYAREPKKYQKMLAAHNLAVADDIEPDTEAYFKAVESTLGIRGSEAPSPRSAPVQRDAPPPAAPVGRQAASVGGETRANVVRLTADEVEIAEAMGMSPKDYARNKLQLKKEGKL